jgi:hypothetical protein
MIPDTSMAISRPPAAAGARTWEVANANMRIPLARPICRFGTSSGMDAANAGMCNARSTELAVTMR